METKKWWQSLTIWGTLIMGFLGLLLPIVGQVDYANFLAEEQAGIVEWLGGLGVLIGTAMAIYGRFRAVKKIE